MPWIVITLQRWILLPLSTECEFWCLLLIPRSDNVDDWEMHCCFVSRGCKTLFMIRKHKWHILNCLFTTSDIIQLAFILQGISNREKLGVKTITLGVFSKRPIPSIENVCLSRIWKIEAIGVLSQETVGRLN